MRSKRKNLGRCQTDFIWPLAKAESVFLYYICVHFVFINIHVFHIIYMKYIYTYTKYVSDIYLILSHI